MATAGGEDESIFGPALSRYNPDNASEAGNGFAIDESGAGASRNTLAAALQPQVSVPRSSGMSGFPTNNLPPSASFDSSGPQPYNANPPYVAAGPVRPGPQRPPGAAGGFSNMQSPVQYSPNINASMYPGNNMPMMQATAQNQQQQQPQPMYATGPMMTPEQSRNPLHQQQQQQQMVQQQMPQPFMSPQQQQMVQQQMPPHSMPQPMQSPSAPLQQSAPPAMHHSFSAPRPGQSLPAKTYATSVHNGSSSD
ncbi:hypothetical protein LPJ57_001846, partial [Coemansia sp. RSA 486]